MQSLNEFLCRSFGRKRIVFKCVKKLCMGRPKVIDVDGYLKKTIKKLSKQVLFVEEILLLYHPFHITTVH